MEFLKRIVAWFKALICGLEALDETPEKIAADQAVLTGAVSYSKPQEQPPVVIYEEWEEVKPVVTGTAEVEEISETTETSNPEPNFQYYKLSYVMDRYIESVVGEKAASTIKGYLSIRRNYFLELQEMGVNEIDAVYVQAALDDEMRKGLALKTVQNAYRFLKNVLEYAFQEHWIQRPVNLEYVKPREIGLTAK